LHLESSHKHKMIETEGARLLWEMRDSWDPTGANATRRLSARPMESEHPV